LYCPTTFPAGPPKINLQTTGAGQVRFNPNLYNCGKVCLSLLGTWQGGAHGKENWDAKVSSLWQVFVSVSVFVFVSVFFFFFNIQSSAVFH
jgi:baculoviral IAP repeat-containing protein 6